MCPTSSTAASTKDSMTPPETLVTTRGKLATMPARRSSQVGPRRPVMVRISEEMLPRIDRAAKRLGLSRAAFILSSTIQQLEKPEDQ